MKIDLDQILALAGDLSEEGSRERFRRFLLQTAKDPDAVRELLASALKGKGQELRSALEDLVVSLGLPLGFDVGLGEGGRWSSPSGVSFLLEIIGEGEAADLAAIVERIEGLPQISPAPPAAEAEAAATGCGGPDRKAAAGLGADLTGGMEEVGEKEEEKQEKEEGEEEEEEKEEGEEEEEQEQEDGTSTIGLLVALDSEILRIEDAVALGDEEGRVRAISVSALTALSKMAKEYHLTHGEVLLILLTTGASADPLIALIARIISECEAETPTLEEIATILGPQRWGGEGATEDALADLIDQSRYYAFGTRGGGKRPAGL
jgi:hypothetical protein